MRRIMAVLVLALAYFAAAPARADRDERWDGAVQACVERAETREAMQQCNGVVSRACMETDDTTIGMSLCLSNEAEQWGALLDPLIERAQAREPERASSLQASHAAWIEWREQECSYQASAAQGGSAQQPMLAACYRDLTAARAVTFVMNERDPP